MIDDTKWNTAQVMAAGVLGREAPKTQCPYPPKELHSVDEEAPIEDLRAHLEKGPGVVALMYYGCWTIWKLASGSYAGELMQYRNVTDSFAAEPLDAAMEKVREWHAASYG